MKCILITGAGGAPAINFTRSLRKASEKFYLIGVDCNKYYLQRAETDEKYLIPPANDKHYLRVLDNIIKKIGVDFIHAQNDIEIEVLSDNREKLKTEYFLPNKTTIRICQNKFKSYKKWKKHNLFQPKTLLIKNEKDLKKVFKDFGKKIWLREIKGAAGKGSIIANNYNQAKFWIDFRNGWGKFTAAEYLSPQSVTWQSLWYKGKLIVAQSRKRLYWEFANRAPSGITGITGAGITISNPKLDLIAKKAILAIDKHPHGIFSVDLTYDKKNRPNPTEINIGRFFTTHLFFTEAGLNMPELYLKLAFREKIPAMIKKINPLPSDLVWVRGMDIEPILTTLKKINKSEKDLRFMTRKNL